VATGLPRSQVPDLERRVHRGRDHAARPASPRAGFRVIPTGCKLCMRAYVGSTSGQTPLPIPLSLVDEAASTMTWNIPADDEGAKANGDAEPIV